MQTAISSMVAAFVAQQPAAAAEVAPQAAEEPAAASARPPQAVASLKPSLLGKVPLNTASAFSRRRRSSFQNYATHRSNRTALVERVSGSEMDTACLAKAPTKRAVELHRAEPLKYAPADQVGLQLQSLLRSLLKL